MENGRNSTHRLCIAPMMGWTDRHQRYFMRKIAPKALLYSEMVTADAVIHGDRQRLIGFNAAEHPVALQLGGSDPQKLRNAAVIAEDHGYDEINLNVGCPSDRVQSGRFGACLMSDPELVAECVSAMHEAVQIPVTVKCRIGIDDQQPESALPRFIDTVCGNGCEIFIIHARKALLGGLSPRQNREVPPLDYSLVYRISQEFPALTIVLNGGITSLDEATTHLQQVDGVMFGRAAYQNPWLFAQAGERLFGESPAMLSPETVVTDMFDYVTGELRTGTPLLAMARHWLPLFQGRPGARAWRRHISQHAHRDNAGLEVIREALEFVSSHDRALAA